MTLDEPVWHTVKRDLLQVGSKLQVVLLPRENQDGVLKKLKDCEWGDGLGRLIGVGVVVVRWNESRIHLIILPHQTRGSVGPAARVPHALHVRPWIDRLSRPAS